MRERLQGKQFKSNKNAAKLTRRPIKRSLFSKIKSVVGKLFEPDNSSVGLGKLAYNGGDEKKLSTGSVSIPGGFFNANESSNKFKQLKSNYETKQLWNTHFDAHESFNVDLDISNESMDTSDINSKLARFFTEKGDRPLNEIEKEGVISLMRKPQFENSLATTPNNSSKNQFESSNVLRSFSSQGENLIKAPTFVPRFDDINTSTSSLRSRVSKRRVFDYSKVPASYKTIIHKYGPENNRNPIMIGNESNENLVSNENGHACKKNFNTTKKMTNTASALLSLIDNRPVENELLSSIANPYSNHVNLLKKQTLEKSIVEEQPKSTVNNASIESSVLKKNASRTSSKKASYDSLSNTDSQSSSNFDKYKPARSSSLKSGVVSASLVTNKKASKKDSSAAVLENNSAPQFSFGLNNSDLTVHSQTTETTSNSLHKPPSLNTDTVPTDAKPFMFTANKQSPNVRSNFTKFANKTPQKILSFDKSSSVFSPEAKVTDKTAATPNFKLTEKKETPALSVSESDQQRFQESNTTIYDFGEPIASNKVSFIVDEQKMKDYESLFVF